MSMPSAGAGSMVLPTNLAVPLHGHDYSCPTKFAPTGDMTYIAAITLDKKDYRKCVNTGTAIEYSEASN